jgi:hypothetical protein
MASVNSSKPSEEAFSSQVDLDVLEVLHGLLRRRNTCVDEDPRFHRYHEEDPAGEV